jgi:anti-sigma factor RsiW
MDCRRANRYLDAYAAGELLGDVAAEVAGHVESCQSCRETALDYMKIREAVYAEGQKGLPAADAAFFDGLSRRLDLAVPPAGPAQAARLSPVRWHVIGGVAAAAAAVFVISVYVIPVSFERTTSGASTASMEAPSADLAVSPSPVGAQAWRGHDPGPRVARNPYITVSSGGAGASAVQQDIRGARSSQPRFTFPPEAWPIDGTPPAGTVSLRQADYERLTGRLAELEARVRTLEETHAAPASR